jgi:hypothetical protein
MSSILKVDTIQDTAGNNIINENANTITIGKAGDTVNLAAGATNNLGITEAQQWRLTTDFTGDAIPIASNWEITDTNGQGYLGTGMTESSGVFTFPSTGLWFVQFTVSYNQSGGTDTLLESNISVTTNNSSFTDQCRCFTELGASGENQSVDTSTIIDVTDTSNVKVRFNISSNASSNTVRGASGNNQTFVTFIRLGNT